MDEFKVPHNIPQDLLLIQEFIAIPKSTQQTQQEDEIDSSDNETVSEDEVAADLITGTTDEDHGAKTVEETFVFFPSYLFCLLKPGHLLAWSLPTPALKPIYHQMKPRTQSQTRRMLITLLVITIYKTRTMTKTLYQTLTREPTFKQGMK